MFWQICVLVHCALPFNFLIIYQKSCAGKLPFQIDPWSLKFDPVQAETAISKGNLGREVASPFSQMYKKLFIFKKLVL